MKELQLNITKYQFLYHPCHVPLTNKKHINHCSRTYKNIPHQFTIFQKMVYATINLVDHKFSSNQGNQVIHSVKLTSIS